MRPKSLPVLFLCFHFCLISILYFFTLCLQVDGKCALIADILLIIFTAWLFFMKAAKAEPQNAFGKREVIDIFIWFILSAGLLYSAQKIASVNGDWDGWAMWNMHARFLTSKENWILLFDPALMSRSPDYPLNLPGFISAFWVFSSHFIRTVPYLAALFSTLVIPGIIYFELSGKSRLVAIIAFLYFILNSYYLTLGMAQYADVLLGLFYLCSLVCIERLSQNNKPDKVTAFLAGFFIVCVLWTKNEGLFFVVPLLLIFSKTILKRSNSWIWMGMFIPLIALLIFKLKYATQNFGTSHFSLQYLGNFLKGERYNIIGTFLWKLIKEQFAPLIYFASFLLIYFLCFRKLNKSMIVVCTAFVLYLAIFVFFDFSLDWQLSTSLNRLLMQLAIPFAYLFFKTLANALCGLPLWNNNTWVKKLHL